MGAICGLSRRHFPLNRHCPGGFVRSEQIPPETEIIALKKRLEKATKRLVFKNRNFSFLFINRMLRSNPTKSAFGVQIFEPR
jgi:hypothetical protein